MVSIAELKFFVFKQKSKISLSLSDLPLYPTLVILMASYVSQCFRSCWKIECNKVLNEAFTLINMNIFILSIKPLKCEFAHSSFSVILLNISFISLSLSPLSTYFAAREGKFTFFLLYYFFILILKKKKKLLVRLEFLVRVSTNWKRSWKHLKYLVYGHTVCLRYF